MKKLLSILLALSALSSVSFAGGLKKSNDYGKYDEAFDKVFANVPLLRSTDELHSLVVLKSGELIYDRHDPAHSLTGLHILWSASKSFTSLALGFAVQDGLLSLDDKVIGFFPDDLPAEISPRLSALTVRDLAIMASGFEKDYIAEIQAGMTRIPAATLGGKFKENPGTVYEYNSTDTYLIGVIVSKLTGRSLDDYLKVKLFKPLGIKDYYWTRSADGYCCGGWGLFLSPESLAKTGQFLLQKGMWKGKQLLDASYIEDATSSHILQYVPGKLKPKQQEMLPVDDWRQGYGYQFWRCTHNAYRMSGAHNQWVIVIPDKDAVVVVTSSSSRGQQLMNLIWEYVYPSL